MLPFLLQISRMFLPRGWRWAITTPWGGGVATSSQHTGTLAPSFPTAPHRAGPALTPLQDARRPPPPMSAKLSQTAVAHGTREALLARGPVPCARWSPSSAVPEHGDRELVSLVVCNHGSHH